MRDKTTNIQLNLMSVFIKNNGAKGFWSIERKAHLYCLALIIEDYNNNFKASVCLDAYAKVGNNDYISLDRPLYKWRSTEGQTTPDRIFVISSVIREKRSVKKAEDILNAVKNSKRYDALMHALTSLVSCTASFAHVVNIGIQIVDVFRDTIETAAKPAIATTALCYYKSCGDIDMFGSNLMYKSTTHVDFEYELIIHTGSEFGNPLTYACG